jgi:hypothetical protein
MRLFPRSARGTWLLAAAVWVAGCTGLWFQLPEAPRATLRLPVDADLIGFGPNGETALTQRDISPDVAALDLLDLPTGKLITTFVERCGTAWGTWVLGKSADHRIWLVEAELPVDRQMLKLDLATRTATTLSTRLAELADNWPPTLSPDGRLCAFPDPLAHEPNFTGPGVETVVWDIANNREHAVLSGPYLQFAFSADGRTVAAEVFKQGRVQVFDVATLAPRPSVAGPPGNFVGRLTLSDDGARVAVEFGPLPSNQHAGTARTRVRPGPYRSELPRGGYGAPSSGLTCWGLAAGRATTQGPHVQSQFAAGGRVLIARGSEPGDERVRAFDAMSGQLLYTIPWHQGDEWEVSPDGQTLLSIPDDAQVGPMEKIVRRLGLPWPFAPSPGRARAQLYNAVTGNSQGNIPAWYPKRVYELEAPVMAFRWFPDGRTLAIMPDPEHPTVWDLWDIPPRKPLGWFALGAAILALPLAGLAWRRSRRLRREVA